MVRERKRGRIAGGVGGRSTTTEDELEATGGLWEGAVEEDARFTSSVDERASRGRARCLDLAATTESVSSKGREGRRTWSAVGCEPSRKRPRRLRCLSCGQEIVDISRKGAVSAGIVKDVAVLFIVSKIAVNHSRSRR
ncbi:hypothetical protein GSI_09007 [Ganoderma sinense ZZ0214-1]|uniref:Uncharacterized protein n=1 Tax=Ganoderma sinense ZZ0214-1 TaxID=1077348 RepID=A0A2G8S5B5_9APHY|nr:hypothetical protein GSI_09007 [Ganoderma sinense ZZ0214-1]